jgi:hypothetical protein
MWLIRSLALVILIKNLGRHSLSQFHVAPDPKNQLNFKFFQPNTSSSRTSIRICSKKRWSGPNSMIFVEYLRGAPPTPTLVELGASWPPARRLPARQRTPRQRFVKELCGLRELRVLRFDIHALWADVRVENDMALQLLGNLQKMEIPSLLTNPTPSQRGCTRDYLPTDLPGHASAAHSAACLLARQLLARLRARSLATRPPAYPLAGCEAAHCRPPARRL